MTRQEAFEAFFQAVSDAIPEIIVDWSERREAVCRAGIEFAHAAANEALDSALASFKKVMAA